MYLIKKGMYFFFILILVLSYSGCNRRIGDSVYDMDFERFFNDRSLFVGETLTIVAPFYLPGMNVAGILNRRDIYVLAQRYMMANPGVYIDVRGVGTNDLNAMGEVMGIELMAGRSGTLMDMMFIEWQTQSVAHFFADWHPIMRADSRFDESEWFMNVFYALDYNNELRFLPTSFWYRAIAPNSTIAELREAFSRYDFVSHTDLFAMKNDILTDATLYLYRGFDVWVGFWAFADSFFCINEGWVDIYNPEFIEFIYKMRELTNPMRSFGAFVGEIGIAASRANDEENRHRYVFLDALSWSSHSFVMHDPPLHFSGYIPLVCTNGNLLVNILSGFALNANATPAQKALAWDFVLFSLDYANRGGLSSMMQAVYIPLFYHETAQSVYDYAPEQINAISEQLKSFAQLPMRLNIPAGWAIESAVYEILSDFHYGLISGRQAAEYLQNRITIVLMEMD